jgi:hypothetical protein
MEERGGHAEPVKPGKIDPDEDAKVGKVDLDITSTASSSKVPFNLESNPYLKPSLSLYVYS